MNKRSKSIVYCLLFINMVLLVVETAKEALKNLRNEELWNVSDFLINYQAGFVRRGFLGEILYQICEPLSLDPRYIIAPLCLITAGLLFFLIVRFFIKRHLCLWILPTLYVCGGADIIRKDCIMMLLVLCIFSSIPSLLRENKKGLAIICLSLILLNVHEASFFIFYPALALCVLFGSPNKVPPAVKVAVIALPLMMMATLCIFKGDLDYANTITRSWTFAYPETYAQLTKASSIAALSWKTLPTIGFHLHLNFSDWPAMPYAALFVRLLVIALILFLTVQISFVHWRNNPDFAAETRRFILLSLLQLLALSPLFTILSCDFRRICFYWTVSSFLAFFTLKDISPSLPVPERLRHALDPVCNCLSRPINALYPFTLLLCLGVPFWRNYPYDYMTPLLIRVYSRVVNLPAYLHQLFN